MIATQIFDILKHVLLITTNKLGNFFNLIVENPQTPTLLQGIGLGILTIFIPMSILIMEKEREFEALDKLLIMEYLIKPSIFVFAFLFSFVSPLLWSGSITARKYIVISCILADLFLFYELRALYLWTKEDKFKARFQFLRKVKQGEKERICWKSVFKSRVSWKTEINFLEIFGNKLETIYKKEKFSLLCDLLRYFLITLNERNLSVVQIYLVPKILHLHHKIWSAIQSLEPFVKGNKQNSRKGFYLLDLLYSKSLVEEIIVKLRNFAFHDSYSDLFTFCLKISQILESKEDKYKESFFNFFYSGFFEEFDKSPKVADIPINWKVTIENLENKKIESKMTWESFMKWAWQKITGLQKFNGVSLDYCLPMIFCSDVNNCDIELITLWRIIVLGLLLRNRLHPKKMVMYLRPYPGFGFSTSNRISEKKKIENSIKLGLYLFSDVFNKDSLKTIIKEIKKIPKKNRSDEINAILNLLENMLCYVKEDCSMNLNKKQGGKSGMSR